jgi:phospholipid/cholesterol/gamma-HCH transport system substrate-binding protein
MTHMTLAQRAIAGALILVFLGSTGYLATQIALGALREDYRVAVVLGELGQGLVEGSDVKMRGVVVGAVGEIRLTEGHEAQAELVLRPGHRIPERATYAVTAKTLLGEKQVEIRFDGPYDEGPFLAHGEVVADPERVVEFQDVLATFSDLMEAIEPEDLAVVVDDLFGAFEGMGPDIARSIDEGARAASTFRRTLDDQIAGTRNLSLLAESLGEVGQDFNRLGREVERGMPTISDNEAEIVRLLDELRGFSAVLDRTLRVTRGDLDRMIVHGDSITRLLFDWRVQLAQLWPSGMTTYGSGFATEGFTHPGFPGQAGYFVIIVDTHINELCDEFPPEFAEQLPGCGPRPTGEPGTSTEAQAEDTTTDLPEDLLDLIQPDLPERLGVDALLRRTVGGALP